MKILVSILKGNFLTKSKRYEWRIKSAYKRSRQSRRSNSEVTKRFCPVSENRKIIMYNTWKLEWKLWEKDDKPNSAICVNHEWATCKAQRDKDNHHIY